MTRQPATARTDAATTSPPGAPTVSVLICTRDRPDDLARCLPTILENDYPDFELVLVDQSTTDASERLVAAIDDRRLRYHRQHAVGKARGLNLALEHATGDIIALTDDDCTAPPDWLRRVAGVLEEEPDAGVVFGTLAAVEHDPSEQFIPTFEPRTRRRLWGTFARAPGTGLGGNMAVRRNVLEQVGGFDECLGPGGRFRASVDWDVAYRALRAGFVVVQDPDDLVWHWGARAYGDGSAQRLVRNYFYGIGAGLTKYARCGDAVAAYTLLRFCAKEIRSLAANLLVRRRATGAGHVWYLLLGAVRALRQPVDRKRMLFSSGQDGRR